MSSSASAPPQPQDVPSLRVQCVRFLGPSITVKQMRRLPKDLYGDLRPYLNLIQQMELFDGEYRCWHQNGQLRAIWRFCWDDSLGEWVRDGESKEWHDNGVLAKQVNHVAGKAHGDIQSWNNDGRPGNFCSYQDGERHGYTRQWYGNGQLYKVKTYRHDIKHGEYKQWHHNGRLLKYYHFKDGVKHGVCQKFFNQPDSPLSKETHYQDGQRHGECKQWYTNGQIRKHNRYKHGKRNGRQQFWKANGAALADRNAIDGKWEGWHQTSSVSGTKYLPLFVQNGTLIARAWDPCKTIQDK